MRNESATLPKLNPEPFVRIKTALKAAVALLLGAAISCGLATAQTSGAYQATNIISDGSVPAAAADPNFVNPWGISDAPGQVFWINTNATGFDYLATPTGNIPFKVIIPTATGGGTGTPTGTVFNPVATDFVLSNGSRASFLFCTLDGLITGWNSKLGTNNSITQVVVNNSVNNASYTDMAIVNNSNGAFILAANFGQGSDIEVYDNKFAPARLAGSFTDPNLPSGYAPYSVHAIGSKVFVTYALRANASGGSGGGGGTPSPYAIDGATPSPRAVSYAASLGAGNGLVDVFDNNGNFVARAVTGGNLNAPWGLAIAPPAFGVFGGDLLVGNFGDGIINAYDAQTFAFRGQIADGTGKTMVYPALWELIFGDGTSGSGDVNTLYFAAGLSNAAHGLFGAIANNASAGGAAAFGFSTSTQVATVTAGSATQFVVSAAPTNGFSGNVSLSCSGLPTGATCSFSPSQLSVSPTASATSTVTIQTSAHAALTPPAHNGRLKAIIDLAFLLPFGSVLALLRKRKGYGNYPRLLGVLFLLIASTGVVVGCSSYMAPSTQNNQGTPPGTMSRITISATSGSITQSTTVSLNVQ